MFDESVFAFKKVHSETPRGTLSKGVVVAASSSFSRPLFAEYPAVHMSVMEKQPIALSNLLTRTSPRKGSKMFPKLFVVTVNMTLDPERWCLVSALPAWCEEPT